MVWEDAIWTRHARASSAISLINIGVVEKPVALRRVIHRASVFSSPFEEYVPFRELQRFLPRHHISKS